MTAEPSFPPTPPSQEPRNGLPRQAMDPNGAADRVTEPLRPENTIACAGCGLLFSSTPAYDAHRQDRPGQQVARPRPAGQFNQSRILLKGNHVEHWLNGAKILEYELDSDALRKAIADSKFKDMEGFDRAKRGHILLQDHGDAVCYRNIKIRTP